MGLSTSEKAEFSTYQLKDVAQAWFVQLRDNRPLRGGPLTCEIFRKAFLDRFFHGEMREAKVVEFINLCQRGMGVHEYSLKFTKLSKCAPSLVFDPRDKMSCFVTGVSDDFQEDCHSEMIHNNMNISHLMVHAKHKEKERSRRKINDAKRLRSFFGSSSKNKLEIQDKPIFKKVVSSQVPSKFPKASGDRVSNPKLKKGKGTMLCLVFYT